MSRSCDNHGIPGVVVIFMVASSLTSVLHGSDIHKDMHRVDLLDARVAAIESRIYR